MSKETLVLGTFRNLESHSIDNQVDALKSILDELKHWINENRSDLDLTDFSFEVITKTKEESEEAGVPDPNNTIAIKLKKQN